jgi:osmotically-inducible protein OsmY
MRNFRPYPFEAGWARLFKSDEFANREPVRRAIKGKIMSSDSDLKQAVLDELIWEPGVNPAHIGVTAHAGVITLTGHVGTYMHKVAAERAASRVKGVKAVAEEIEVKLPYDIKLSDEDIAAALSGVTGVSNQIDVKPAVNASNIKKQIENALHRSWYYDPDTITVTAQGGKITLSGKVTTWNARRLASSTAWSAPGATSVENNISIS